MLVRLFLGHNKNLAHIVNSRQNQSNVLEILRNMKIIYERQNQAQLV